VRLEDLPNVRGPLRGVQPRHERAARADQSDSSDSCLVAYPRQTYLERNGPSADTCHEKLDSRGISETERGREVDVDVDGGQTDVPLHE